MPTDSKFQAAMDQLSTISLDAAGLVALADLDAVCSRTALTGTSALLDCLVLCPGLHRQQDAPKLNLGEYPICAAMTTGYVFRIENQATVTYLQKIARAGQLTQLSVSAPSKGSALLRAVYDWQDGSIVSTVCYFACVALSVATVSLLISLEDWWAVLATLILVLARLINVVVVQRRSVQGWKGEPEPDKKSDLIVLLSQDRWVRIQGDVNDVKAITSGEWLRQPTFFENGCVAFATLMVYLDAALAGNGTTIGKLVLLILLFGSAGLLGLCNEYTSALRMYGRSVKINGFRKKYQRRLHLAEDLVKETGRSDWAFKLDMLPADWTAKESQGAGGAEQAQESNAADGEKGREYAVIREL